MTPLSIISKVICLSTLPVSITLATLKTPTPLESQSLRASVFSSALMLSSSVWGTAGMGEWKSVCHIEASVRPAVARHVDKFHVKMLSLTISCLVWFLRSLLVCCSENSTGTATAHGLTLCFPLLSSSLFGIIVLLCRHWCGYTVFTYF